MKKIVLVFLSLVTLSFGEPVDRTGPYLAIGGGYAVFEDDQRMDASTSGINSSYNINVIAGAFINRYLSVEIAYDYFDIFTNNDNVNTTKLNLFDVSAKAHYPFWKDRIDLYAAFGAGQVHWTENTAVFSQDDQSGILRGDVGVGIRALNWLTLNIGYRQYFFTLDQLDATGAVSQQYDMQLRSAYTNIEVLF